MASVTKYIDPVLSLVRVLSDACLWSLLQHVYTLTRVVSLALLCVRVLQEACLRSLGARDDAITTLAFLIPLQDTIGRQTSLSTMSGALLSSNIPSASLSAVSLAHPVCVLLRLGELGTATAASDAGSNTAISATARTSSSSASKAVSSRIMIVVDATTAATLCALGYAEEPPPTRMRGQQVEVAPPTSATSTSIDVSTGEAIPPAAIAAVVASVTPTAVLAPITTTGAAPRLSDTVTAAAWATSLHLHVIPSGLLASHVTLKARIDHTQRKLGVACLRCGLLTKATRHTERALAHASFEGRFREAMHCAGTIASLQVSCVPKLTYVLRFEKFNFLPCHCRWKPTYSLNTMYTTYV